MSSNVLRIRSARMERALYHLVGNARRRLPDTVINAEMRPFVRDTAAVTPPNRNFHFSKAAGTRAIRKDLARVMRSSKSLSAEDPETVHQMYRLKSTGRIRKNLKREKGDFRHRVRGLPAYIRKVQSKVGKLAAGWAPAAGLFRVTLPPWITRHAPRGEAWMRWQANRVRIHIANRVLFANNVRGLERRVQAAANNRARQMERRTAHFLFVECPRLSGFRVTSNRLAA